MGRIEILQGVGESLNTALVQARCCLEIAYLVLSRQKDLYKS